MSTFRYPQSVPACRCDIGCLPASERYDHGRLSLFHVHSLSCLQFSGFHHRSNMLGDEDCPFAYFLYQFLRYYYFNIFAYELNSIHLLR